MTKSWFRLVCVTVITVCVLPVLINLLTSDITIPAWLKPYLLAAAVLVLAVLVYTEFQRGRAGVAPIPLDQVADRLAESIKKQWSAEAHTRQLNEPAPLPVPWTVIQGPPFDAWDEVVRIGRTQHARWPAEPVRSVTQLDNRNGELPVHKLFAKIPTHRLVMVGPPGAGKTGLLVQLVLRLLDGQNREVSWPERPHQDRLVPVLFPLSSWPAGQRLREWLVDRLIIEHPALQAAADGDEDGRSRAEALVERNLILPVLDGFDEIPEPMRITALEKISEALRDSATGIIIASREKEFAAAAKVARQRIGVVHGAVAVRLDQLTVDSVRHYLDRYDTTDWQQVLAQLGTDSPIGAALRTPLMVSLAHTVYNRHETDGGSKPDELLAFRSEDEVGFHLFDAFVPAAYRDRPSYAKPALGWLKYLAVYLQQGQRATPLPPGEKQTAFERQANFEWWRLRESVPFPVIGLAVGLLPAAAVGAVAALVPGLGAGLGLGMLTGLATATVPSMIWRRRWPPRWQPGRAPGSIGAGIAGGFLGALLGAVPTGIVLHFTRYAASPVPGLMGALGAGIGVGVCFGRWRGAISAAVGGAVVALTAGTGAGLAAGVIDGAGAWLVAAFTIGAVGLAEPSRGIRGMGWSKAGYLTGATVGISIGTGVALMSGPTAGLIAGSVAASAGGFAAGLEGIPVTRTLTEAAAGPAALLARDRGTCWLVAAVAGTGFGLGAGLAVRLPVGLAAGLTVGLIAATIQASWLPFLISRWWFAATGHLPLRLISFLRDAHRRGILRQEGGAYQFRHLELQKRLAGESGPGTLAVKTGPRDQEPPRSRPVASAARTDP